ncbi:MAG TPA: glutamine--fructose-6-phosphate transaminase (isomerizing) [Candidatus Omnitrophota bacterium]|nr:glutamine--fructose-6-phosphate transaminase (isomerizing) [Candidatus Omnitrophota bacterium]
MCGIVGYIGPKEIVSVLLGGLEKLEYRGYDSSGIACVLEKEGCAKLVSVKEKGKLISLKGKLAKTKGVSGHLGIGHTRWATHGAPSTENAHPHGDCTGKFFLVHNGIIENYAELKRELIRKGHRFSSETDTEVAVHLIEEYYNGNVLEAFRKAIRRMNGFFAFVMITAHEPGKLFAFKRSNPLVIGIGAGENFVASDVPALLAHTRRVIYLDDNELAVVEKDKVSVLQLESGKPLRKEISVIKWDTRQAEKEGYPHFMLKEIYEQPHVIETTLKALMKSRRVLFENINASVEKRLKKIQRVHFVSCGTAYHAGLVGGYMVEKCVRLSPRTAVSSEFRYENPAINENDLIILITQSGETADTLAALREGKARGALTLAIVNVVGSTIAREADCVIYTHAGPEIGVASTKAYLAQLMVLALFSVYFGQLRGALPAKRANGFMKDFLKLPSQVREVLKQEKVILRCAQQLYQKRNFLYLGRGFNFPNALEGALKLKEISYAHAHGYPAGEMKHGPIALIDQTQPVICLAPFSCTYEKMISNIEEIRARKGIVISIASRGDGEIQKLSHYVFYVPQTEEMISPILTVIPLQLFAYHIACLNDRDVDQPRNLAKSVTVE